MSKRIRIKRQIVKYQLKDLGANPLTKRGRKWIKKEIRKCDKVKAKILRKELEDQSFTDDNEDSPYWSYVDKYTGGIESTQANPDSLPYPEEI